jgi:hypothetical protein
MSDPKLCDCTPNSPVFEWFGDQGIAHLVCCGSRVLVARDADGNVRAGSEQK